MKFLAALILFSSLNAIANPVSLRTASGDSVQVEKAEVVAKYTEILRMAGYRAEEIFVNDDGSVTFVYPYFKYKNEDSLFIAKANHNDSEVTEETVTASHYGICKLFGYANFNTARRSNSHPDKFAEIAVLLNREGKLAQTRRIFDSTTRFSYDVLKDLTCSGGPLNPIPRT